MTEQPAEEYEDVFPLLGAIGPYLSFTTGHMNPIDETDDAVYPEEEEPQDHQDPDDTDYWEDNEQ